MAELKTKKTTASVQAFFKAIPDHGRRKDCLAVTKIMKEATKSQPKMWGSSIVGFGSRKYKYASGREGDWPLVCFSPRKQNLTLYGVVGSARSELLSKLGKYKIGGSCLHIKRLADIDETILKKLIAEAVARTKAKA